MHLYEDDRSRTIVILDGQIDPVADYQELHSGDGRHDHEQLDALLDSTVAVTAGYTVPSGRHLAEGTQALAAALRDPYALRTTADARVLINALRDHISALAGIAQGLDAWLGAAHERGETSDPACVRSQLAEVAAALKALPGRLDPDAVPADASPPMDPESLIANVTEQLRLHGVVTGDPTVFEDTQVQWELANGATLILRGQGWELTSFSGEIGVPVAGPPLPYDSFSHPAQIAGIVAQSFGPNGEAAG